MSPAMIRHQSISASAGSGKTFALAHRYLRLLALGVPSDRICALTFSRKAAGEIFDSIVERLCVAAMDEDAATATAALIECGDVTRAGFVAWLREFIDSLHRNHIGTLDSFIIGIIRNFPTEVGVPIDFDVMDGDGAEAREVRADVLERVLRPSALDPAAQAEFLEAFKQATFGREEKGVLRLLERFIVEYRQPLLKLPDGERWGRRDLIWGDAWPWPHQPGGLAFAATALHAEVERSDMAEPAAEVWITFCEAVQRHSGGAPLSAKPMLLMQKLLKVIADLATESAVIPVARRRTPLSPPLCRAALEVVRHFISVEIGAALEETAGIHKVLSAYERVYQEIIRRTGRMTFEDSQYLLAPGGGGGGGLVPSRQSGGDGRLYIDYRLDSQLDHWLLDEFQDTSDLQWSVLANLVDEVLQDTSQRRSFFYVGDVKQAIYGWRGGNARLFGLILDRYGSAIEQAPLHTSYRSCEPVIDTVNLVFDSLEALDLDAGVTTTWNRYWEHHACATGHVPGVGYATIVEPACDHGAVTPAAEDRYALTAELIDEIRPQSRGLSTAVLVRTNDQGQEIVEALRRRCPEVTVVHEGHASITDSPAVKLLLAVLRYAAHPGDTMARGHILMSPLGNWLERQSYGVQDLPLRILEETQYHGMAAFVERWAARLDQEGGVDAFARIRLGDLASAAAKYDARAARDIDSFLSLIESYTVREEAAENVIRVMTIHQSKGLGFDVVFLPALMGPRAVDSSGRSGVLLKRDESGGELEWALRMPVRDVCNADEVLCGALRQFDEEDCFESLCVLYVAMTRAKRALYMITSFGGKTAKALTEGALVKLQLCGEKHPVAGAPFALGGAEYTCLYETGDRDWYASIAGPPSDQKPDDFRIPPNYGKRESLRTRLGHVLPSGSDFHVADASMLFSLETREILDFGTAIHRMFEAVEWAADANADAILEPLLPRLQADDAVKRDVSAQFRSALGCEEVRRALQRPEGDVELWRERRFDIVLDGNLVTGTFDRVVVTKNAAGQAVNAEILDYKSNRVQSEAEIERTAQGYREQLTTYRRALAKILGIAEARIACRLIFTRPGRVVTLS
ncbi:MAG: UvrD-helicase domain-containing protein [Verrucomicrobia bacterium]|nr:UvrD-helicase domain-containing protein [Verrucomicrobiota bacterium]MDA1087242.1 UvrD-helicase domain-containing protein [Verrucomicrobiota bacterium]